MPAVTAILQANLPGWARDEGFLASSLLDRRWADVDPPSLVAVEEGKVVGFMGAQARRLVLDDRELLGVCASQLAVNPEHRGGAAGALLMRRLLSGPQDLTWVDSATDLVTRMWRAFGGEVDLARAVDWMLVLRPLRWTAGIAAGLARERKIRRRLAPVAALPFQAAGRRLATRAFPEPEISVTGGDATAAEIAEALPEINRGIRLRVGYEAEDLEHQLGRIRVAAGEVDHRLVHDGDQTVGWYAYLPRRRTASRVLHLAALDRRVDAVLYELITHARASGASALSGRVEPHLAQPVRDRIAALGFGLQPLRHSRNPELETVLASSASLLTELDSVDSSWWYQAGPADA